MAESPKRRNPFLTLAFVALLIGIFYVAEEVLLPIALGVLLSFLLAPIAERLEKWKLGRIGSVTLTVVLAFALITGVGWLVTSQVVDLLEQLPAYEKTLVAKIEAIRGSDNGILTKVGKTADRIEKAVTGAPDAALKPDESGAGDAGARTTSESEATLIPVTPPEQDRLRAAFLGFDPIPVRIVDTTLLPLRILRDLGPLMAPLGMLAIVVVFVVFFLIQREDLRDRIIRLAGTGRVFVTTQAFDDAGRRVSQYLLTQLIINAVFGLCTGIGLYFIGLPNTPLWGLLAMILRFIPYLGPMIAAVTPIALSLAVFDGWTLPLATVSLFVVLELITSNVLEPWLYGSRTGISAVGIIAAGVFWTWLWGPLGLVLSTPLTVCVTVVSRHMPQFAFLNILLADDPPLESRFRFYQRLLAQDFDEASDVAKEFMESGSLAQLYEELFVPALTLAERDRDAGRLSEDQESFVYESIGELIDELTELDQASQDAPVGPSEADALEPPRVKLRTLCVAAEDEADRIAAIMFAQLLTNLGHVTETMSAFNVRDETLQRISEQNIDCVVISTIAPARGSLRSRHACRRLRRRFPTLKILVGYWKAPTTLAKTRDHLIASGADFVTASFAEGLEKLQHLVASEPGREIDLSLPDLQRTA